MQYFLELVILPNKVVKVALMVAVIVSTSQKQEATVNAILGAAFLVPIRAKNPAFFAFTLSCQWRQKNCARLEVDNLPHLHTQYRSPILQNDSGPQSSAASSRLLLSES